MSQPERAIPEGDRQGILNRIAEALRFEAPRHHEHNVGGPAPSETSAAFRQWLPPVGKSRKEQIALFAQQSETLRTELRECVSVAAAKKALQAMAEEEGWTKIAVHRGELLDPISAALPDSLAQIQLEEGYAKRELESCDVGLTECEVLVAQTGSICVTTLSSGGRALSVLPPHHIVVARAKQMVPDLSAAYEFLRAKYADGAYPSFISFITGPSRTGDIERILVLGAHGPKRLTVLLVP